MRNHSLAVCNRTSSQVIQLPTHVLVGQCEQLAHGPATGFAQCFFGTVYVPHA
jgi:hypothetical protein